jgi:hypothetical protein
MGEVGEHVCTFAEPLNLLKDYSISFSDDSVENTEHEDKTKPFVHDGVYSNPSFSLDLFLLDKFKYSNISFDYMSQRNAFSYDFMNYTPQRPQQEFQPIDGYTDEECESTDGDDEGVWCDDDGMFHVD